MQRNAGLEPTRREKKSNLTGRRSELLPIFGGQKCANSGGLSRTILTLLGFEICVTTLHNMSFVAFSVQSRVWFGLFPFLVTCDMYIHVLAATCIYMYRAVIWGEVSRGVPLTCV